MKVKLHFKEKTYLMASKEIDVVIIGPPGDVDKVVEGVRKAVGEIVVEGEEKYEEK